MGCDAGVCLVQVVPSHVHVSPKKFKACPPNITTCWRARSYAMPMSDRLAGRVGGDCCVHTVPSQAHVSLKMLKVPPPNITATCRAPSQPTAMFARRGDPGPI